MSAISESGGRLWHYYVAGGDVMHLITVCSVVSLTVIFYKLVVFRRIRVNLNELMSRLRAALLKGNLAGAIAVCEEHGSPVAAILESGLRKYGRPRPEIEKTMENAAIHEVAYLENYLAVLATVTGIAPLLGFLGTVVGMILSFDVVAEQGLSDPSAVARGISVALITTAWGLIVAFLTQPFYHYFLSRVTVFSRQVETAANVLFETLDEMEADVASRPVEPMQA